jgi:hypothetical protein
MQRVTAVEADLVDLRAPGAEAHREQPRRHPRLHRMHARRPVAPQRGVETDQTFDPFAAERGELRVAAFELGPRDHRGLP